MGQGTESCGGYEVDYDPHEEGLEKGQWTQRNGVAIKVSDMSVRHLVGARRIAAQAARNAGFSSDSDMWQEWVDLFDREINSRPAAPAAAKRETPVTPARGRTVTMICHCGNEYLARTADINRGWALSCSKSCAATRRDYGRPAATAKNPA